MGGKVRSGESDENAAIREMEEEIGRVYPIRKVVSFIYDEKDYKAIFSIFTTTIPVSLSDFKLDMDEIQYSREFSIDELMLMLDSNPKEFAPTFMKAITEFKKHIDDKHVL